MRDSSWKTNPSQMIAKRPLIMRLMSHDEHKSSLSAASLTTDHFGDSPFPEKMASISIPICSKFERKDGDEVEDDEDALDDDGACGARLIL